MGKLAFQIDNKFRNKPVVVIIVFLAWVALAYISLLLIREDYNTSVYGYRLLPTQKVDENLVWMIGALPTLLQIAFGYWAIEKGSRIASVVTFVAFLADCSTDIYFKANGNYRLFPLATVETIVLFTFGSEFLFLASLENIAEYAPDVIASVIVIIARFGDALSNVIDWVSGNDNNNKNGYTRK